MNSSERYHRAAHRVQTAIAFLMGTVGYNATESKHLRVGIDLTKAENAGLAELLIEKGVFTVDEYREAMAKGVEKEADQMEADLSAALGVPVSTK